MNLSRLALVFLKVGTVVFGGGMAIIPLLEPEVVSKYHWLTHKEFVDAVALGQLAPGPILIFAALIGYKVSGFLGALVATISVFLPSFLMTLLAARQLVRFKDKPMVQAFLKGVMPAVVGFILASGVGIARRSVADVATAILAVASIVALTRFKVDAVWVILAAGAIGVVACQ